MEEVEITQRTLIGGKMRQPGEVVSVYPWQARRLKNQGRAAEPEESAQGEDELAEAYGSDIALTLRDAGYTSVEEAKAADPETLLAVNGIGKATLRKIQSPAER